MTIAGDLARSGQLGAHALAGDPACGVQALRQAADEDD
jgi:hypothetical protein